MGSVCLRSEDQLTEEADGRGNVSLGLAGGVSGLVGHMPCMLISNPTPTAHHRVASALCCLWVPVLGLALLSVSRPSYHPGNL